MTYDFCIIGGGIVGLAAAMNLLEQRPGASLLLLEKEGGPARHQTGHNSGVVHAGIYYAPGSLKAELCRAGVRATKAFCAEHKIPLLECGKLVVATSELEAGRLATLHERAVANGIEVEAIDAAELGRREPHVSGVGALWSPTTAVVGYGRVSEAMARVVAEAGAVIQYDAHVTAIADSGPHVEIRSGEQSWAAKRLVVCGGLQADRLAVMAGLKPGLKIIPFRGEYYQLPATRNEIVRSLIYPVPDPALPFLGIHLTRMIDGSVTVGPSAVLGLSREGYAKFAVSLRDIADYLSFSGFWKLASKNMRTGLNEVANWLSKRRYLEECRKYCPDLTIEDLLPYNAGIRAQAVLEDGTLLHDFHFAVGNRSLHVLNAPSPAATAAIPIGAMIATKCLNELPA